LQKRVGEVLVGFFVVFGGGSVEPLVGADDFTSEIRDAKRGEDLGEVITTMLSER
jgi:hypothetical protein